MTKYKQGSTSAECEAFDGTSSITRDVTRIDRVANAQSRSTEYGIFDTSLSINSRQT